MSKFFDLSRGQRTLSVFLSVVLSLVVIAAVADASSTISTSITTGGDLSVTGNSTLTGNTGFATSSPYAKVSIEQGSEYNVFAVADSGTSTPSLVVVGNGNIGLGTIIPTTKLEVTGTASSSALVVGGGTAITYVKKGTCSILISANVPASTTMAYDCAVTGVESGDTVFVQTPTGAAATNLTRFVIVGAKASTTAGYISFDIANQTGVAGAITAAFASTTQYLIAR